MGTKPDRTKFLKHLNTAVDYFEDYSQTLYNNVIAISHNDADGISSLQIIQNLLHKMKFNYDYFIYNRSVSWGNYLNGILSKTQNSRTALIFTDVGSNLAELVPIIKKRKEHFYILDHHEVDSDFVLEELPENLFFVNPTVFGFDGLDHVSGATLAYLFAKKIKKYATKNLS
jgi:single-stranded DNA-specific DHH superfamily exonuclease